MRDDLEKQVLRQEATIERLRRQVAEAQRDKAIAQKNEQSMRGALEPIKRRLAAMEANSADPLFKGKGE
jgi:chromosome segregation ATPase